MKKFELIEELDNFTKIKEVDEFASLGSEVLENSNDPEGCANYISWRLKSANQETDESKKKDILKSTFGYICSMEKVEYTGWNLQELAISKIDNLNVDLLLYFKTLTPEDYTNKAFKRDSMDRVIALLSNRLKQLDTNFKW